MRGKGTVLLLLGFCSARHTRSSSVDNVGDRQKGYVDQFQFQFFTHNQQDMMLCRINKKGQVDPKRLNREKKKESEQRQHSARQRG